MNYHEEKNGKAEPGTWTEICRERAGYKYTQLCVASPATVRDRDMFCPPVHLYGYISSLLNVGQCKKANETQMLNHEPQWEHLELNLFQNRSI